MVLGIHRIFDFKIYKELIEINIKKKPQEKKNKQQQQQGTLNIILT